MSNAFSQLTARRRQDHIGVLGVGGDLGNPSGVAPKGAAKLQSLGHDFGVICTTYSWTFEVKKNKVLKMAAGPSETSGCGVFSDSDSAMFLCREEEVVDLRI